jgi:hypothetical protein
MSDQLFIGSLRARSVVNLPFDVTDDVHVINGTSSHRMSQRRGVQIPHSFTAEGLTQLEVEMISPGDVYVGSAIVVSHTIRADISDKPNYHVAEAIPLRFPDSDPDSFADTDLHLYRDSVDPYRVYHLAVSTTSNAYAQKYNLSRSLTAQPPSKGRVTQVVLMHSGQNKGELLERMSPSSKRDEESGRTKACCLTSTVSHYLNICAVAYDVTEEKVLFSPVAIAKTVLAGEMDQSITDFTTGYILGTLVADVLSDSSTASLTQFSGMASLDQVYSKRTRLSKKNAK